MGKLPGGTAVPPGNGVVLEGKLPVGGGKVVPGETVVPGIIGTVVDPAGSRGGASAGVVIMRDPGTAAPVGGGGILAPAGGRGALGKVVLGKLVLGTAGMTFGGSVTAGVNGTTGCTG